MKKEIITRIYNKDYNRNIMNYKRKQLITLITLLQKLIINKQNNKSTFMKLPNKDSFLFLSISHSGVWSVISDYCPMTRSTVEVFDIFFEAVM